MPDAPEAESAPIADSVRLALPKESAQLAEIQRRCWPDQFPAEVADVLLQEVTAEEMVEVWHGAITRPPQARCRVLVAVEQDRVVGFATTVPSDDPDADPAKDALVNEWLVDPPARGRGHGSRLLNAVVDTLRADGFTRATTWLGSTEDVRRRVLTEAGWATDGSHREVGPAETLVVKQLRLHTDITPDPT
ncbi:N-acetyltransferase family protein [Propionibacteriaceae bacterium Y1685]|uniref:GNAT family N-acetyltransferase n=1 Tax=Microlunatus sp. Y1700 TaxID=3418487 RepID=UPI003B7BB111